MNTDLLFFYMFSGIAILSAIMVIASKNPIHSVLFLILVFLNASALLMLLGVDFIAMLFLVVYVGAIAILFLFVVMMLNIRVLDEKISRYLPSGAFIATIFLVETFIILTHDLSVPAVNTPILFNWEHTFNSLSNVETLGYLLYTHYFYLFFVASLVLLVAMVGAIVLTMQRRTMKRQLLDWE